MLYAQAPAGFARRPVKYGPYSASRLIVAQCAHRFFGQYIRKDRSVVSTINASRGSAIHHIFSLITQAQKEGIKLSTSQVSAWVHEGIGLFPLAYDQVDLIKSAADAYIVNPSPYLNQTTDCEKSFAVQFFEEETFDDSAILKRGYVAAPYANEQGFPNTEAFFGGKMDQITVDDITKTVVILDHKTTPNASKNEDVIFQMGCYAWLASLFYPGYQIKTVVHYAHPDLNFYGKPEYWSQEELSKAEWYIHNRIWAIESFGEFPALPGTACDYCHMVQECPENLALVGQRARGQIDLNTRTFADLPRIASQLRSTGALYDELSKALKRGIELHAPVGGVAIEGGWFGFKTGDEAVEWVSTDLKIREESGRAKEILAKPPADLSPTQKKKLELQAQLVDLGAVLKHWHIDPNTFKEWQSKKLQNLWRLDKPGLLDMLKEFVVKERSTRWGWHKN